MARNRNKRPIKNLVLNKYTSEAWDKTHPEEEIDDFFAQSQDMEVLDYIESALDQLDEQGCEIPDDAVVKIVPIDEAYFEWLENTGKEDSPEMRMEYQYSISEKDRVARIKANHWDENIELICVPINFVYQSTIPAKTDIKMTSELSAELKDYLEQIYGKDNVFVFGCVNKLDFLLDNIERFQEIANNYFRGGTVMIPPTWLRQRNMGEEGVLEMAIPYAVRTKVGTEITAGEVLDYIAEYMANFNEEGLAEIGHEEMEPMETCDFHESFMKVYPHAVFSNINVLIADIPDFLSAFAELFEGFFDQMGMILDDDDDEY